MRYQCNRVGKRHPAVGTALQPRGTGAGLGSWTGRMPPGRVVLVRVLDELRDGLELCAAGRAGLRCRLDEEGADPWLGLLLLGPSLRCKVGRVRAPLLRLPSGLVLQEGRQTFRME